MLGGQFTKTLQSFRYCANISGAIAIMFGFSAPLIVGSAGMALDYAQSYLVKQRLSQAVDAAALAGASYSSDAAEIEQKVREFFDANYPPDVVGFTFEPIVKIVGDQVQVTGRAYHDTTFLKVLGIDKVHVEAYASVNREIRAVEVALVLDNTGSMGTNNNIKKLKTAAQNFVSIMFDGARNDNLVKIGLVPYANAVRIGSYGLGKNPDGSQYADGDVFVNLPDGFTTTTNKNHSSQTEWFGCVLEYNEDGYDPESYENDPYPNDVLDQHEGPWEIYKYETPVGLSQSSFDYYTNPNGEFANANGGFHYEGVCPPNGNSDCYIYVDYSRPANSCPHAQIVPLTSDRDFLEDAIGDPDDNTDGMRAHGFTLGNIGVTWGGRLISPEKPFTEGSEWDNYYWKKAIVFMTDGANTREANYSAFWRRYNNELGTNDYNARMAETCQDLKDKGVKIYTVTFTGGANATTREFYKNCATSEDNYKHTDDPDELVSIFEGIARELSLLHISE